MTSKIARSLYLIMLNFIICQGANKSLILKPSYAQIVANTKKKHAVDVSNKPTASATDALTATMSAAAPQVHADQKAVLDSAASDKKHMEAIKDKYPWLGRIVSILKDGKIIAYDKDCGKVKGHNWLLNPYDDSDDENSLLYILDKEDTDDAIGYIQGHPNRYDPAFSTKLYIIAHVSHYSSDAKSVLELKNGNLAICYEDQIVILDLTLNHIVEYLSYCSPDSDFEKYGLSVVKDSKTIKIQVSLA